MTQLASILTSLPAPDSACSRTTPAPGASAIDDVRQLTRDIASGDTGALARLYRMHFDRLLQEASRLTGGDEAFCLDVVHDTMLRVIRRMKPLDSDAALHTWLNAAVRSAAIDRLRAEWRRTARERRTSMGRREASRDHSANDIDNSERLHWLRRQLELLDSTTARAFDLRYRLNWTLKRIAASLHLTPGSIDGRINRTLSHMRNQAKEEFDD